MDHIDTSTRRPRRRCARAAHARPGRFLVGGFRPRGPRACRPRRPARRVPRRRRARRLPLVRSARGGLVPELRARLEADQRYMLHVGDVAAVLAGTDGSAGFVGPLGPRPARRRQRARLPPAPGQRRPVCRPRPRAALSRLAPKGVLVVCSSRAAPELRERSPRWHIPGTTSPVCVRRAPEGTHARLRPVFGSSGPGHDPPRPRHPARAARGYRATARPRRCSVSGGADRRARRRTRLVDELRAKGDVLAELTVVAELDGAVVGCPLGAGGPSRMHPPSALGHSTFARTYGRRGSLGPHGCGDRPADHSASRAWSLGDPGYYGFFGFEPASGFGIGSPGPWGTGPFKPSALRAWRPELAGPVPLRLRLRPPLTGQRPPPTSVSAQPDRPAPPSPTGRAPPRRIPPGPPWSPARSRGEVTRRMPAARGGVSPPLGVGQRGRTPGARDDLAGRTRAGSIYLCVWLGLDA